ncbi:hypothetical protein ABKV19_008181, partial [Rosa sericea]
FEHCGAVPLESCTSLFTSCQQCFKEAHWETGKPLPLKCTPIRFGSWMRGDQDGNPNVTAKVTKDVSLLSRWMTIDLYIKEVDSLKFELSMNWCSDSLSKLAQEILEHEVLYDQLSKEKWYSQNLGCHRLHSARQLEVYCLQRCVNHTLLENKSSVTSWRRSQRSVVRITGA